MDKIKIAISICGEGHGHYGRNIEIVKSLLKRLPGCSITLYLYGQTLNIFRMDKNLPKSVVIKEIPGYRFHYKKSGIFTSLFSTGTNIPNLRLFFTIVFLTIFYIIAYPFAKIRSFITKKPPYIIKEFGQRYFDDYDFAISDLEPLLPRVSVIRGKPFLTLDNQHAMLYGDLNSLKLNVLERIEHFFICMLLIGYHPRSDLSILTSFCKVPIKERYKKKVAVVGPLMRHQITSKQAEAEYGDYILIYAHTIVRDKLFTMIKEIPHEKFVIFTLPDADFEQRVEEYAHIEYQPINPDKFIDYLTKCKAVISTTGNTLLSEAIYLKKPYYGISLEGLFEQRMNLYLLKKFEWGEGCSVTKIDTAGITAFIENIECYKHNLTRANTHDHTDEIVNIIIRKIMRDVALPYKYPVFLNRLPGRLL